MQHALISFPYVETLCVCVCVRVLFMAGPLYPINFFLLVDDQGETIIHNGTCAGWGKFHAFTS